MDYNNKQSPDYARSPGTEAADEYVELPELPPMYAVVILNDDLTPMRFVVELLEDLFHFNRRDAVSLMMTIHTQGRGLCGRYSLEVARTKKEEVIRTARAHGHPLRCVTEELEDK